MYRYYHLTQVQVECGRRVHAHYMHTVLNMTFMIKKINTVCACAWLAAAPPMFEYDFQREISGELEMFLEVSFQQRNR